MKLSDNPKAYAAAAVVFCSVSAFAADGLEQRIARVLALKGGELSSVTATLHTKAAPEGKDPLATWRAVADAAVRYRAATDPAPYAGRILADGRFNESEIDGFLALAAKECPSLSMMCNWVPVQATTTFSPQEKKAFWPRG